MGVGYWELVVLVLIFSIPSLLQLAYPREAGYNVTNYE